LRNPCALPRNRCALEESGRKVPDKLGLAWALQADEEIGGTGVSNSANGDSPWLPPQSEAGGQPPTESVARRVRHGVRGSRSIPQSLIVRFDARYVPLDNGRAIELAVCVLRDDRVGALLAQDAVLLETWKTAELHLGVRSSVSGQWRIDQDREGRAVELPSGDTAYIDLGLANTSARFWHIPPTPASLIIWLYVYANRVWLPFDPNQAFPHRVDRNGALRCFVPN
jgi:hypothetical protein